MAEFDGTAFSGWQRQKNAPSVQACLEDAWQSLTGETISLQGGSRTDAGVSALRHVSSFLSASSIPCEKMAIAWNTKLPPALSALQVREVGKAFHPRYDALGKSYRYSLARGSARPAILRNQQAYVPGPLNLLLMQEAAEKLLGEHDFTAFMDQGSPTMRPIRTLHELDIREEEDRILVTVTGDGFLYHMVRILLGTLVLAGQGKLAPRKIAGIIKSGDRTLAGPTMAPQGLLLERLYFADTLFGRDAWPYPDPRREEKKEHLYP